jgi:hypothetical protein
MAGGVDWPSVGFYYNADIRNNGTARRATEAACRLGMKEKGFVRYTRPCPEPGRHALNVFIDDGRDDIAWLPPKPNACWLVDTHLGYDQRLAWAKNFDYVFLAQLPDVERMKGDGLERVYWLPLACSPYLDPCYKEFQVARKDLDVTRIWDCVFVGYLNRGVPGNPKSHDRVAILDELFKAFPNSWLVFNQFFEQAALHYVKAKVGLNVSIAQDLNMRFFEALSYGVCQVCNRDMVGWEALGFLEDVHFLAWDSVGEAKEKIQWALNHMEEREQIAEAGWKLVREKHTYEHRVLEMLSKCGLGEFTP